MKRYVIERGIPGIGNLNREQYRQVALTLNVALDKLGGKVQWEQTYVVGDKTFCIYLADSLEQVREHARLSGFPADRITEVCAVIDPMTEAA